MKLRSISEQVVVIVGATSGIGRAAALEFARHGARVVIGGRSLPDLDALADEIRLKGGQVTPVVVDVSEYDQVKALADRTFEEYGRIDTWVSSAAVMIYAELRDTQPEEFKRLIDVNLMGQVYGAMAALPYLERSGGGALIHISSVASKKALPLQSAYSASKFGLRGFVDALKMEVIHQGLPISITHLMPASINTPLYDRALTRLGVKPRPVPPVYEPEAVADAILYAAEHPVRELFIGGAGKGLSLFQRLSPRLAEVSMIPYAYEGVMSNVLKSTEAPSNLFWHLPGYDYVRGSYSAEARRTSIYTWLEMRPLARLALSGLIVAIGGFLFQKTLHGRRREKRTALRRFLKQAKGSE